MIASWTLSAPNEATFHLKDFLGPKNKYPYDTLAPAMEKLAEEGMKVSLISVPGFLIGYTTPLHRACDAKWFWSDCNGMYFRSAEDLLSRKNGKRTEDMDPAYSHKTKGE